MNPAFRSAVFGLPLCDGSLNKPTEFVKGGKRKMLFEIQRLCVFLQEVNKKAWSTKDLTQSFGWYGGEAQQQQDIQELNRILFEAIEKALKGTFYETLVQDMYFGVNVNYITCLTCGTVRSSEE